MKAVLIITTLEEQRDRCCLAYCAVKITIEIFSREVVDWKYVFSSSLCGNTYCTATAYFLVHCFPSGEVMMRMSEKGKRGVSVLSAVHLIRVN